MGRKKKIKEQPVETKEIKASSKTTLTYSGDVTVSVLKGRKVIKTFKNHNEGGNSLYKFILNCLAGYYYDNDRPKWIVPVVKGNDDITRPSIPKAIPINRCDVLEDDDKVTLSYKCLISATYLAGETKVNGLAFFSQNDINSITIDTSEAISDKYSMIMYFGEAVSEDTFQNQNLLITWQVRIVSATQENQENTN